MTNGTFCQQQRKKYYKLLYGDDYDKRQRYCWTDMSYADGIQYTDRKGIIATAEPSKERE